MSEVAKGNTSSVGNIARVTQYKLKRLTRLKHKSEIIEGINSLHVTTLSLREVPG